MAISVVINTRNEEKNIKRCLDSVKWADEIVVVDMKSTDKTVALARKYGAKTFTHRYTRYVEPVRNFAISKATGDWILILDADEVIPLSLAKALKKLAKSPKGHSFFRLPRKNIIFGKWVKHSRWWPDLIIRFFKKGAVTWSDKIHSIPLTRGEGKDLEAKETNAIIHYHYESISQYLERLNRYTDIQLQELIDEKYQFQWQDLIKKPIGEFLSRFFAGEGHKDGVHGLVIALLQAFSEFVLYLKVWEKGGFREEKLENFDLEIKQAIYELNYWRKQKKAQEMGLLGKILLKIKLIKV